MSYADGDEITLDLTFDGVVPPLGTLEAEGRCQNVFAWQFNPSTLSWITLVSWEWDKGTGWGEDHDNWSNTSWRAFERAGYRVD